MPQDSPISHAELEALAYDVERASIIEFHSGDREPGAQLSGNGKQQIVWALRFAAQRADTQADLTERARAPAQQLAVRFTEWIARESNVDFWSENNAEDRLAEMAQYLIAAALQSEREAAAARNLFVPGEFGAHSGGTLPFKIDCDALSDADITTLAAEIARRFKFDAVYGVPRGGVRLANALAAYLDPSADKTLIVDDVLTTGRSMEEARARLHQDGATEADPIGVVIFARGPCPPWITPLFATPEASEAASIATRRAAGQWHGHRYSEFQDQLLHKDMNKVTRARIEGQMLAHNESAKHFGALASPTPQEETRC